jgi:hypothetical protein
MAESCRSLQLRDRKSGVKKADAQGISPFFLLCKAQNSGSEPIP